MLDLNQRPPPCKFGQSFPGGYCPVGKSSLFKQFLPFLAALFSCSVRVRPAPVAAWLQHLTFLRPVEVGLRRRRRNLFVRKLMEHYPTQGDKPYQNVHLALTAVGASIA